MNEFVIDLDHIEKGIKNWEKFAKSIDDAVDEGLNELYRKTDAHIGIEASRYGLNESALHRTKTINLFDNTFEIRYSSPYAVYVEFGTGIVGKNNPHPNPLQWSEFRGYDVNGHGDAGWHYLDTDNKLHWTKGMPARPVMYNTRQWLKTQATRTIRKYIRQKIKGATGA